MYCPQCNKEGVDFNSVAVNKPTSAFTLDLEGPVDPTVVRSSSTVINVCKTCGSQDLFPSAEAHSAAIRQAREDAQKKEKGRQSCLRFGCIGGVVGGIIGGFVFLWLAGLVGGLRGFEWSVFGAGFITFGLIVFLLGLLGAVLGLGGGSEEATESVRSKPIFGGIILAVFIGLLIFPFYKAKKDKEDLKIRRSASIAFHHRRSEGTMIKCPYCWRGFGFFLEGETDAKCIAKGRELFSHHLDSSRVTTPGCGAEFSTKNERSRELLETSAAMRKAIDNREKTVGEVREEIRSIEAEGQALRGVDGQE